MTDPECERLLHEAVDAFESGDFRRTLDLSSSAARDCDDSARPRALFWMGMGNAALGRHERAAELWRAVRDDRNSDAAEDLLSIRAAVNLARLPDGTDPQLAGERRALARLLVRTLGGDPHELPVGLGSISFDHLMVLVFYGDSAETAALARAALAASETREDLWSTARLVEMRVYALIASIALADEEAAQTQIDELSAGGDATLPTLESWARRLEDLGPEAPGHLVLLAACIRLEVLLRLGRTADATRVYEAAQRTQAANDAGNRRLVGQLHQTFARERQ